MAAASESKAAIRARSARRSANGPTPQNRSATILALPTWPATSRARVCSPAAVACRKTPGGSVTCARPIVTVGAARCAISSPWRVRRASRWVAASRASARHPRRVQRAGAAHVHVDAGVGRGDLDVERLASAARAPRRPPRPPAMAPSSEGASTGQRSMATMWCARSAAKPTSRISRAPRRAWNVARRRPSPWASISSSTGASRPACCKRVDDEAAFPVAIAVRRPMLDRAAAADAEMRAERLDALGARGLDPQQMAAIRMAGDALDLDGLAGQRIGHEERARRRVGHAVAAVGEAIDDEPFGHDVGRALQAGVARSGR